MIASENFVPVSVLECQGSVLTNKYAEGYPGRRYYGGCEWVDIAEQLAIDRRRSVRGRARERPAALRRAGQRSGVPGADAARRHACSGSSCAHWRPSDARDEDQLSGGCTTSLPTTSTPRRALIDMDEVERLAQERRPKVILAGWSAYSRVLDFKRFREIADSVDASLVVDMAHFAGLVAAELHPESGPVCGRGVTTNHAQDDRVAAAADSSCRPRSWGRRSTRRLFPGQQADRSSM